MHNTHLDLCECVSSIELTGILDLDSEFEVRVTDKNGRFLVVILSLRSILIDIVVPSSGKPPFPMIAVTGEGEYKGVVTTGREREGGATKAANHVASAIINHFIFDLSAHPDNIVEFIRVWFSTEHIKIAMDHSSYNMEKRTIILNSQLQQCR